jgi:hypothetical protein
MTQPEDTTTAGPLALSLHAGLGFTVGDAVMLRKDLYEGPNDCSPGGYLARRGEKLIVRGLRAGREWPLCVSHECRTDGNTFAVGCAEVEPWRA